MQVRNKSQVLRRSAVFRNALVCGLVLLTSCSSMESLKDDPSQVDEGSAVAGAAGTQVNGGAASSSIVSLAIIGAMPDLALAGQAISVLAASGDVLGTLELSEAKVVLDEIKLNQAPTTALGLKSEEDDEDEVDESSADVEDVEHDDGTSSAESQFKGPYLVDLLTNEIFPEPEPIKASAVVYREIELKIHKVEDSDMDVLGITETSPLYKNSIYLAGTFTKVDGSEVAVTMSYDLSEKFELSGLGGLTVTAGEVNPAVIAFKLASWFDFSDSSRNDKQVDFSTLTGSAVAFEKDGDEALKDIREAIKENIKASADFGKDKDGDGVLSAKEDADHDQDDDSEEDASESESESEPESESALTATQR